MLTTEVNYSVLAIWNPRTQTGTYNGAAATIQLGTLLGRITATGYIVPQVSTATDGSQVPIGVMTQTTTFAASTATDFTFYIKGDMNFSQIIFGGSDTLATEITVGGDAMGTINDIITGKGLLPIPSEQATFTDYNP